MSCKILKSIFSVFETWSKGFSLYPRSLNCYTEGQGQNKESWFKISLGGSFPIEHLCGGLLCCESPLAPSYYKEKIIKQKHQRKCWCLAWVRLGHLYILTLGVNFRRQMRHTVVWPDVLILLCTAHESRGIETDEWLRVMWSYTKPTTFNCLVFPSVNLCILHVIVHLDRLFRVLWKKIGLCRRNLEN